MSFRHDLFEASLEREKRRLSDADHLTPAEKRIFSQMIALASYLTMNALPSPVGRNAHLPPNLLKRVEQTMNDLEDWQLREAVRRHQSFLAHLFAPDSSEERSAVVLAFPSR